MSHVVVGAARQGATDSQPTEGLRPREGVTGRDRAIVGRQSSFPGRDRRHVDFLAAASPGCDPGDAAVEDAYRSSPAAPEAGVAGGVTSALNRNLKVPWVCARFCVRNPISTTFPCP